MHQIKLFLAAAALFAGSVSMLRAESVLVLNSGDFSTPAASSSPIAVPSEVTVAPPVVAVSPAVEIAARDEVNDQPQEEKADLNRLVYHRGVLPERPAAHRARARSSCAHRPARWHKRAVQERIVAPRAPVWLAAPSEAQCSFNRCWKVVLLGVGY